MYVVNRVVPSGTGMRLCTHTHTHSHTHTHTHTHTEHTGAHTHTHTHTHTVHTGAHKLVFHHRYPIKRKRKKRVREKGKKRGRIGWGIPSWSGPVEYKYLLCGSPVVKVCSPSRIELPLIPPATSLSSPHYAT